MSKKKTPEERQRKAEITKIRRDMREQNKQYSKDELVRVPYEDWPEHIKGNKAEPVTMWRSRDYLILAYEDESEYKRLSMCRTDIDEKGQWRQDLSWETIQMLKDASGHADHDAVEIFPRMDDIVNVANMRHLWIMPEPLSFAWRPDGSTLDGTDTTTVLGKVRHALKLYTGENGKPDIIKLRTDIFHKLRGELEAKGIKSDDVNELELDGLKVRHVEELSNGTQIGFEHEISPDKLDRAALLRHATDIMKAAQEGRDIKEAAEESYRALPGTIQDAIVAGAES